MSLHDDEALVIGFLADQLGVQVRHRVPAALPPEWVQVQRTGGSAVNRVLDAPQITVTAWANSSVRAKELANLARSALLGDTSSMTPVRGSSEVGGLYWDPDPDTGTPRYTCTIELRVRAAR